MRDIKVNEKFKSLIPPLSEEEYSILEESINTEGIREPIVLWSDGSIIDGHNRYNIAMDNGFSVEVIPVTVREDLLTEEEVMLWMIDNQRGRRNLPTQAWLDLGFKRAELLRPMAEANQEAGRAKGRESRWSSPELDKTIDPVDTTKEAADYAGVSRATAAKYKKVMSEAPEETKKKVSSGGMSINKAYQEVTKHKEVDKQETVEDHIDAIASKCIKAIESNTNGESKEVYSAVLSRLHNWIKENV